MWRGPFKKKEVDAHETAYANMTPKELSKEITELEAATHWTPEQLAALDPEARQYVEETIRAVQQQERIARASLRRKER